MWIFAVPLLRESTVYTLPDFPYICITVCISKYIYSDYLQKSLFNYLFFEQKQFHRSPVIVLHFHPHSNFTKQHFQIHLKISVYISISFYSNSRSNPPRPCVDASIFHRNAIRRRQENRFLKEKRLWRPSGVLWNPLKFFCGSSEGVEAEIGVWRGIVYTSNFRFFPFLEKSK